MLRDARTRKPVRYAGKYSSAPVRLPRARERNPEFRGVWVALVHNIDFPRSPNSEIFRKNFLRLADDLKRKHFNAIIFQVRAAADAAYVSKLNPMSRFLTGTEGGTYGGFDPLPFMVAAAHRRGLEFHAWLNPYRVTGATKLSKRAYLKTLSPRNFAAKYPHYVLAFRNGAHNALFLNPGEPEVRRHIVDTVREILARAPVDAIHFDDYFYPYTKIGGADLKTYRKYNPRKLSLGDWRRENVDRLIREVSRLVRSRKTQFGVSPFGIWGNAKDIPGGSLTGGMQARADLYADIRKWIRLGQLDYVAPQLYWGFSHELAAYAALSDWWSKAVRGTRTKLYTGHGVHRIGTPGMGENELVNQVRYDRRNPEISGFCLFSYRHVSFPGTAVRRRAVEKFLRTFLARPARPR